ncbi:MAG: GTP-binding protein [archaeon]|nr:GTP-binding protein [archaeon]
MVVSFHINPSSLSFVAFFVAFFCCFLFCVSVKVDSTHTIGVEFGTKILQIGDQLLKLQIWDTAGQERFRSVTRSYYRGAAGALLVYDITSRDSYNRVSSWLADARSLANPDIVIVLVGNKADLDDSREVTFLEASRFAQENDLIFLESSAHSGEGVTEVFSKCSRRVLSKLESGVLDPQVLGSGISTGGRPDRFTHGATDPAPSSGGCC